MMMRIGDEDMEIDTDVDFNMVKGENMDYYEQND